MIEVMRRELLAVEEAIELEELGDRMYLKHYTYLLKKRRFLMRMLKKWERRFRS